MVRLRGKACPPMAEQRPEAEKGSSGVLRMVSQGFWPPAPARELLSRRVWGQRPGQPGATRTYCRSRPRLQQVAARWSARKTGCTSTGTHRRCGPRSGREDVMDVDFLGSHGSLSDDLRNRAVAKIGRLGRFAPLLE